MTEPQSHLPEDDDATLKPPQFSLRSLLVGTTAVAALLTLMMAVGAMWSLAILFLVFLVAAHVIGNSLGTRLRDGGVGSSARPTEWAIARPAGRTALSAVPSPVRLRERSRLHWINLVLTLGGVAAGGYVGGASLAASYPDATIAAHTLAYVSSGVLGGFAIFAVSSFLSVVRQALSEAHAGGDRRPSPARRNVDPARRNNDSIERN